MSTRSRAINFYNHLFGSIAGPSLVKTTDKKFIPKNNKGDVIRLNDGSASWLGLKNRQMQKYAYDYCFPVSTVCNRLAEYDINGIVEILRKGGKGANDYATSSAAIKIKKLLEQPNPLQSWAQFRGQQVVYKKVFGFAAVIPFKPAGFGPEETKTLFNIPPWCITVNGTKDLLYTTKMDEIVKYFTITLLGKTFTILPEDLIILEDGFLQSEEDDFLLPQSKLVGLDMAVSNVCAAMEADNVLLKKRGPMGFVSHDAAAVKDSMSGYVPMFEEEKEELQDTLMQYGLALDQFQFAISRTAVKWNPTSFNVAELGTKETILANTKVICHAYSFPYTLYDATDATYANGKNAETAVYEDNVIPNAQKDFAKYNKYFKADDNNIIIVIDYSHISALQEDKLAEATARKAKNEACQIEYDNNLITLNQWREIMGYDKVAGDDVFKRDIKPEAVDPTQEVINDPTMVAA